MGTKLTTLPLFPDLLEQSDPLGRNRDYEHIGHRVWTIGCDIHRSHGEDKSELICLSVVYDDERFRFKKDRTGKRWVVEINHHFYQWGDVTVGWGASRKTVRKIKYRCRTHEKRFATRDEAIDFAEKVRAVMLRMKGDDDV